VSTALYNTLSAAIANAHAVDVTAHNVANASTTGFRAQRVSFGEVLGHEAPGVTAAATLPDSSRGEVKSTGRPLDLALGGDGYFVLGGPSGPRFTRAGAFQVSADGVLSSADGLPVMGQGDSLITVPPDARAISVGEDGTVKAGDEEVGILRIAHVAQQDLQSEGARLMARPGAQVGEVREPRIQSGALESANFDVVHGMMELIRSSRSFEAATKAMQTISDVEKRTANGFNAAG
jgi:flagellar basal-body rod protein FlgF